MFRFGIVPVTRRKRLALDNLAKRVAGFVFFLFLLLDPAPAVPLGPSPCGPDAHLGVGVDFRYRRQEMKCLVARHATYNTATHALEKPTRPATMAREAISELKMGLAVVAVGLGNQVDVYAMGGGVRAHYEHDRFANQVLAYEEQFDSHDGIAGVEWRLSRNVRFNVEGEGWEGWGVGSGLGFFF